ncbi:hypothetical protein EYF80_043800 [Liparis tanakae]|uniref:Uncharacterized protein n=1 Tax=Liparis tanakae TaxID=230148 RepID=A0A4Z2FYB6_9TELE|nr:hypothetical protein EYF80_043800 [Liparis tanakae]
MTWRHQVLDLHPPSTGPPPPEQRPPVEAALGLQLLRLLQVRQEAGLRLQVRVERGAAGVPPGGEPQRRRWGGEVRYLHER